MSRSLALTTTVLLCMLAAMGPTWAQASTDQDTLNRVDDMGRKHGYWRFVAPSTEKAGYPDGALVEEGRYNGGKRVGLWRRYWPNGKVMSEITYQMGRPKGAYTTYYPSGRLEEQGTWDLDRNTGKF
nr:hypothetical protein [Flavobacteriales bacterium]